MRQPLSHRLSSASANVCAATERLRQAKEDLDRIRYIELARERDFASVLGEWTPPAPRHPDQQRAR